MQKWRQHDKMAAYCYFRQFRVVEDDLKLFCKIYIMLCHLSNWAVDSSYSWNVHCFQIRWRICQRVGIVIKGSLHNQVNAAMNPVSIVASYSRWQKAPEIYEWGGSCTYRSFSQQQKRFCFKQNFIFDFQLWWNVLKLIHTHYRSLK